MQIIYELYFLILCLDEICTVYYSEGVFNTHLLLFILLSEGMRFRQYFILQVNSEQLRIDPIHILKIILGNILKKTDWECYTDSSKCCAFFL